MQPRHLIASIAFVGLAPTRATANGIRLAFALVLCVASVHPWTGHDVDGDGNADAVIGVDVGGGNRCCWTYYLVGFLPRFRPDSLSFTAVFLEDARRRTLLVEVVPFYDLGRSMAEAPTIYRVHQYRGTTRAPDLAGGVGGGATEEASRRCLAAAVRVWNSTIVHGER